MLTGILVPTSGEISVNGLAPYKDRMKNTKNIGDLNDIERICNTIIIIDKGAVIYDDTINKIKMNYPQRGNQSSCR